MRLPPPKFRIDFDEPSHRYTLEGLEQPSVTTLMSDAGLHHCPWASDQHRIRGSAVHLACEYDTWGQLHEEETSPLIMKYVGARRRLFADYGLKPVATEIRLGSLLWHFCGTTDLLAESDALGGLVIVDYKSGQPSACAEVQLWGYDLGLRETYGIEAQWRMVVRLRPDGRYTKPYVIDNKNKTGLHVFKSICQTYNYKKAKGIGIRKIELPHDADSAAA